MRAPRLRPPGEDAARVWPQAHSLLDWTSADNVREWANSSEWPQRHTSLYGASTLSELAHKLLKRNLNQRGPAIRAAVRHIAGQQTAHEFCGLVRSSTSGLGACAPRDGGGDGVIVEPALRGAPVLEHRVGLRPERPAIRLEVDPGEPRVVHNYGHSGIGVSVSWGCADAATALALRR